VIRRCTLVAVGKLKGWAAEGSEDYAKRLRRYFPVEIIEVAEEDMNRRSREEVLSAEAGRILKRLPAEAYVISLDREKGKQQSSEGLARRLEDLGVSGRSHVVFVIGGPLGLSPEVLQKAD
jgi:23S rRNA (pseudouridine1915-N3)-methyltransferase